MNETDEREIRDVLARYTDLWVRHEMDDWGALFTEDSDFITHQGIWWRTRAENVAGHKDVPASVLAQKGNYTQDIVGIQAVTPDVALVHTAWSWPGHVPSGSAGPEDRRGLVTLVMTKARGRWLIRAAHNTRADGPDGFSPPAGTSG